MQKYQKPQVSVGALGTSFSRLYELLGDTLDTLLSNFSGTAFPPDPAAGQSCFRTDRLTAGGVPKLYLYSGLPSLGESGWIEVSANSAIGEEVLAARGTKSTLDERLDAVLNEDGTLKAGATADKLAASDIVQDFVVSGLLGADPGASLTMTIPGGTAYVLGLRVLKLDGAGDLTRTYTAGKDTYVDISNAGVITYVEVNNGAGAPAVTGNSLRLMKVVTNGTEITGVTDLRTLAPVSSAAAANKLVASQSDSTLAYTVARSKLLTLDNPFSAKNSGSVTVTNSATDIATIDLGTVVSGQEYEVEINVEGTKGATAGMTHVLVGKSSGTASIAYCLDSTDFKQSANTAASSPQGFSGKGNLQVTADGTLVIKLYGISVGSNLTVATGAGQLRAIRIK